MAYLSSSVDPHPIMVGFILRLVRSKPLNGSGRHAFRIRLVKVTLLDNLMIAISFFKVLESYLKHEKIMKAMVFTIRYTTELI